MLARAAQRRLRSDARRAHEQLALPWLCPAQMRWTASLSATAAHPHSARRARRPSTSTSPSSPSNASPGTTRTLTTAELQPAPGASAFHGFMTAWNSRPAQAELARMPRWDPSNPLIIYTSPLSPASTTTRIKHGIGGEAVDLLQNLYACLRVGRLERASLILERLRKIYDPAAPEMVDTHSSYLAALLDQALQEPKPDSMATITRWYETHMVRMGIQPSAKTFVALLRAAVNLLDGHAQDEAIREYMAQAKAGHVLDEVNESEDFWDEEWDVILRAQPDDYHPPPPVAEVQETLLNGAEARRSLIEHGLLSPGATQKIDIKPVAQKGLGLDTLLQSLAVFHDAASVPYPHDMPGTQEDKDHAYAYERQLRMEQDNLGAAVRRWKKEDEKLAHMGIHSVMTTKPIQAIMYNWYLALVPLFKKHIDRCKTVMAAPTEQSSTDPAHAYGAWLERMKPEQLAALTISRCLTAGLGNDKEQETGWKVSTLASKLGKDFMNYLHADVQARRDAFIKKQRKQVRAELLNKLHKTEPDPESQPTRSQMTAFQKESCPTGARVQMGALAIELLLQCATLTVTAEDPRTGKTITNTQAAYLHRMGYKSGKKVGLIVPHHKLVEKLRNERVEHIAPTNLPMVVEPKPWVSYQDGGYYTLPQRLVRQKNGDPNQRAYAESAIDNGDMAKVMAGLDTLGRVPWQINAPVFRVMAQAWNTGEVVGGLVEDASNLQAPEDLPPNATAEQRAVHNKKLRAFENRKTGLHSQRCFQNFVLETARAFVDEKKIFFPHSVDFRGRAYPIPPLLNHLGADMSRGLLKFARRKELGTVGLQWLKIHLANLYGFDKASLTEREQFAMDNINEIYDSATNPLNGRRWWTNAEDPWQCLACCMELKNALDSPDPTRFQSQLPVHQDGTCNGLQHYAALGGDHAGARQVNLEPSDRPQDIYTGVAELVKEMVAKDAKKGLPIATFMNGHISRKVVKRTVMTNVYGVTFMGAKKQVEDELRTLFPNFKETDQVKSVGSMAMYIAFKIFEALGKIFNGAQEIQHWLGECGDRITSSLDAQQVKRLQAAYEGKQPTYDPRYKKVKKPSASQMSKSLKDLTSFRTSIIWTTPLKMPVVQPYRKENVVKVKTKVQELSIAKLTSNGEVSKRKQLQAFPPNFIHSLDATHMTLSALKCGEMGLDFAAVHDSFWSHACDIPNLNVILRDAFVRMHSEDVIGRLAEEFKARYAGAMYRASIFANSEAGRKIKEWRLKLCEHRGVSHLKLYKTGQATLEELALESRRRELLNSEDPELVKHGKEIVTPTSIWLEHQDPKDLSSPRLNLLGDTGSKAKKADSTAPAFDRMREKVLDQEAEMLAESKREEALMAEIADDAETAADDAAPDAIDLADSDEAVDDEVSEKPAKRTIRREDSRSQFEGTVTVWTPLTFPPVPKKGDWDVTRLRESQYFFS